MRTWTPFQLAPCVDAMAVRAHQFKVAFVRFPVLESSAPRVIAVLWAILLGWVNMIDVKDSNVVNAALATLPAKIVDDLEFAFPISFSAADSTVSQSPFGATIFRAKAVLGRTATLAALPVDRPSLFQVTFAIAEPTGFLRKLIWENFELRSASDTYATNPCLWFSMGNPFGSFVPSNSRLVLGAFFRAKDACAFSGEVSTAMTACMVNRFHVIHYIASRKTYKYFDIACRRVEQAMNAEPLWEPETRIERQTEMFAEVAA